MGNEYVKYIRLHPHLSAAPLRLLVVYLRNRVRGHLVTFGVQILHLTVVGPLVRHVESGAQRATVRIDASLIEQIVVQLLVQIVDRIVEGEQHQLRDALHGQIACLSSSPPMMTMMWRFVCEVIYAEKHSICKCGKMGVHRTEQEKEADVAKEWEEVRTAMVNSEHGRHGRREEQKCNRIMQNCLDTRVVEMAGSLWEISSN